MFSKIHHFLNSHWEFTFLLNVLFDWLFYRQGYRAGLKVNQEKGNVDE